MRRLDPDALAVGLDGNDASAGEPPDTRRHRDRIFLQEMFDPARELIGDPTRSRDHRRQIDLWRPRIDAEPLGVSHRAQHVGRGQQRLGWNASPIEANPTETFPLDEDDFLTELRRSDRGDIAARPPRR
jgi:hypothetical protein